MERLKGYQLIPGKLYTFCGKNNKGVWPLFAFRPTPTFDYKVVSRLYPLEPFVFLERLPSDYRQDEDDQLYDYKILTTKGEILWLNIHDHDLAASFIGFREFTGDLL
jgi:hypothetical protein